MFVTVLLGSTVGGLLIEWKCSIACKRGTEEDNEGRRWVGGGNKGENNKNKQEKLEKEKKDSKK